MSSDDQQQTQRIDNRGSGNIFIQNTGDNAQIRVESGPSLTLIPGGAMAATGRIRNETDLLNPHFRGIPLVGRTKDLSELRAWLNSDRRISVRTLTGRAGTGKTRLALELLLALEAEEPGRWDAGFLRGPEIRRFSAVQNLSSWKWSRPVLAIVDYAAPLADPLRLWLEQLAENFEAEALPPFRLLLLEREASGEHGWLRTLQDLSYVSDAVANLYHPLVPVRVASIDSADNRREILTNTLGAVAAHLNVRAPRLPAPGEDVRFDRQLALPDWEDPLYLMMAALVTMRREIADVPEVVDALALTRTDLARRLAKDELRRLQKFAPEATGNAGQRLIRHVLACATLAGGLDFSQALEVADEECTALKLNWAGGAGDLADALHRAQPGPESGVAAVGPDILGEALVLEALGEEPKPQRVATVMRMARRVPARVVNSLIRATQDFAPGGATEPLEWLEALIRSGAADDAALLRTIDGAMPHQTVVLSEKAAEVTGLLIERTRQLVAGDAPVTARAELARLLTNQSVRLNNLGQGEKALAHAEEGLRIYLELSGRKPGEYILDTAIAQGIVATRLGDLGRKEEAVAMAEEACRNFERLAHTQPAEYRPALATALNNYSNDLSEVGRYAEGLEKAEASWRLRMQISEGKAEKLDKDLATSLTTLANRLTEMGRFDEAVERSREVWRIYAGLAAANPDAFMPDVALALNNLSLLFCDLGQLEEALAKSEECARIYEHLAAAKPEVYLPGLAQALSNLSGRLSALGRKDDALVAVEKSLRMREQLAAAQPHLFLQPLGASLNNTSIILGDLGRREEALKRAEEALGIAEKLYAERPQTHGYDLAIALNNLALRLDALGRMEDALVRIEEARRAYGRLAAERPEVFSGQVAMTLNNWSRALAHCGRKEEALAKAEEALGIYERLAETRPEVFLPEVASALNNVAVRHAELHRPGDVVAKAEAACRIYERLSEKRPAVYLPLLAGTLNNLANRYGEAGRKDEAVAKAEEAVRLYRVLVARKPAVYTAELALGVHTLAVHLAVCGRDAEALAATEEAVQIREKLAAENPEVYRADLARSMNNLASRYYHSGRTADALSRGEEAVRLFETLAQTRPEVFLPELAQACGMRSICLGAVGLLAEAAASSKRGVVALTGHFQQLPETFQALMAGLCNQYAQAADLAGEPLDESVLAPLDAVFTRLANPAKKD